MTTFVGQSPFAIPSASVSVTVDSTSTLGSGGTLDWWGRASVVRRSDDVLVLTYRRGTAHDVNDGGLYIKFSNDDGATWTAEDTKLGSGAVTGFPMNPSTLTSGEDAGEPLVFAAPSGDLLLHMWRVDYNVTEHGTYQSRSSDGGETWSASAQVSFASLPGGYSNNDAFSTDQVFTVDDVMYGGIRVYHDADQDPSYVGFIKSEDDGVTWTYVSTIVSPAAYGGHGQQEVGLVYLGDDNVLAIIRDTAAVTHTYMARSTDLGATWGSVTDATSLFGVSARHRVYTRAFLRGQANWWKDPVLVCTGFIHTSPGNSLGRRNAVWVSRDRGTTWSGPNYVDTGNDDGGYGDIFYDSGNDQYVVVSYNGTLTAASLKQYRLTIAGI